MKMPEFKVKLISSSINPRKLISNLWCLWRYFRWLIDKKFYGDLQTF